MEVLKIWKILIRRRWVMLLAFLVFVFSVLAFTLIVTPSYKATTKILVKSTGATSSLFKALDLQSTLSTASTTEFDTDIALALSKPLVKKVINKLQLKDRFGREMREEKMVKSSILNLLWPQPAVNIEQYEESTVLEVIATSADPQRAADIVNLLANYYIEERKELTNQEYQDSRAFVEQKIDTLKQNYYESLEQLTDFQIADATIDFEEELKSLLSRISTLIVSRDNNENNVVLFEEEIKKDEYYLARVEQYRKGAQEFIENPRLDNLKTRLHSAFIELSRKKIDFSPSHPEYQQVTNEIEELERLVRTEITLILNKERFDIDPLHDDLSSKYINNTINLELALVKRTLLNELIASYQEELLTYPLKKINQTKLTMQLEVDSNLYKNLLSYLTEIKIAESINFANYQIIEPAKAPGKQRFPNKKLNLIIGVILGGFWALVVGFFVEYTDDTLRSHEDLKQFADLSLLGQVYKHSKHGGKSLLNPSLPTSHAMETFRTIKNNIYIVSKGNLPSTIIVTSSVEGEGKSSIAANLAMVYAMEGKKTLLIDADLRAPSLHHFFSISKNHGFSDLLSGAEPSDCVTSTEFDHLDLIGHGSTSTDPGGLIETCNIEDILHDILNMYDLVIFASPSLDTSSDTLVLNRTLAAHFLLVVEPGKVTYTKMEDTISMLKQSDTKLLGAIANKVRSAEGGNGTNFFDDIFERILLWPVRTLKRLLY